MSKAVAFILQPPEYWLQDEFQPPNARMAFADKPTKKNLNNALLTFQRARVHKSDIGWEKDGNFDKDGVCNVWY